MTFTLIMILPLQIKYVSSKLKLTKIKGHLDDYYNNEAVLNSISNNKLVIRMMQI